MTSKIVKIYDYRDEASELLYQNCRYEPKTFKQRRPDGNGDWVWNLDGTRRVLYRLPELLRASPLKPVFLTEGEQDADNLRELGLVATTAGAAHNWNRDLAEFLNDRKVCISPDNDRAGRELAFRMTNDLRAVGCPEIKVLKLTGLGKSGDITDWLNNGGTQEKLLELVNKTRPETSGLVLDRMAWVNPENIEWFWANKIPNGALTIIAGDPGSGKSFLSLFLAAQISKGKPFPDSPDVPVKKGTVILITDEDDPHKVVRPRLDAHGADVDRIFIVKGTKDGQFLSLAKHLSEFEDTLKENPNCRLLVLDPITSYIGSVNANSNAEVRSVLTPFAALAAKYSVCIIGINHFNKRQGDSFMYRGLGSTAFVAQARSAWGVLIDKDDRETRIFCPIKSNYCIEPTGLKFRIIDGAVQFEPEPWTGHIDDTGNKSTGRIDEAAKWLQERLGNADISSTTIFEEGKQKGFSRGLLYRTKEKLGIKARKLGFDGNTSWFWRLSDVD